MILEFKPWDVRTPRNINRASQRHISSTRNINSDQREHRWYPKGEGGSIPEDEGEYSLVYGADGERGLEALILYNLTVIILINNI